MVIKDNKSGRRRSGLGSCKSKELSFYKKSGEYVEKKYYIAFIAFHRQYMHETYKSNDWPVPSVFLHYTNCSFKLALATSWKTCWMTLRFPGWCFWFDFHEKCGECGELLCELRWLRWMLQKKSTAFSQIYYKNSSQKSPHISQIFTALFFQLFWIWLNFARNIRDISGRWRRDLKNYRLAGVRGSNPWKDISAWGMFG